MKWQTCFWKSTVRRFQLLVIALTTAQILDNGCCGMAGSFGFEAHKFDLSKKVFTDELESHLEANHGDAILMADGFSCKTQIEENTGLQSLHLAQVIEMGMTEGTEQLFANGHKGPDSELPRNDGHMREWITAAVAAGILLCGGVITASLGLLPVRDARKTP
jgi:hypothetical protein